MFYFIINVLFFIIASILILFTVLRNLPNDVNYYKSFQKKSIHFINKNFKIIVCILFVLTIFTSIFKLGEIPYGLHVDEAGMAYDAFCISNYGVDRYLNKYPVYLINYGGGHYVCIFSCLFNKVIRI